MNKSAVFSATSNDISISVVSTYLPEQSDPAKDYFVYTYDISILNHSPHAVQLLSRFWRIVDLCHGAREVEGEGVVGVQPVIEPGASHVYDSWSPLRSDMGFMEGYFVFLNLDTNLAFKVAIPRFELMAGCRKN